MNIRTSSLCYKPLVKATLIKKYHLVVVSYSVHRGLAVAIPDEFEKKSFYFYKKNPNQIHKKIHY